MLLANSFYYSRIHGTYVTKWLGPFTSYHLSLSSLGSNTARDFYNVGKLSKYLMVRQWFFSDVRSCHVWYNAIRVPWGLPSPMNFSKVGIWTYIGVTLTPKNCNTSSSFCEIGIYKIRPVTEHLIKFPDGNLIFLRSTYDKMQPEMQIKFPYSKSINFIILNQIIKVSPEREIKLLNVQETIKGLIIPVVGLSSIPGRNVDTIKTYKKKYLIT